jgi:hypothetical protein
MATLRHGIPNGVFGDRRVALKFSHDQWLFFRRFGITGWDKPVHRVLDAPLKKEIREWIASDCTGTVRHVTYQLGQKTDNFVWEFFFKTPGEALVFKLRFG